MSDEREDMMEPRSGSILRFPGIDSFLKKLGVSSQDSDFLEIRAQVERAIACDVDFSVPPPYHWEDVYIEREVFGGAHVIDLGCGDGELLVRLVNKCEASVQGVESDESSVLRSIERGIPVYHDDVEHVLRNIGDDAYDFAILENTLQTLEHPLRTLDGMLRIARTSVISFPNFAHWSVRLAFSVGGRMPVTSALPYTWYNTPNIHLCSITDFLDWVDSREVEIVSSYVLVEGQVLPFDRSRRGHNITGEQALFFIRKKRLD